MCVVCKQRFLYENRIGLMENITQAILKMTSSLWQGRRRHHPRHPLRRAGVRAAHQEDHPEPQDDIRRHRHPDGHIRATKNMACHFTPILIFENQLLKKGKIKWFAIHFSHLDDKE